MGYGYCYNRDCLKKIAMKMSRQWGVLALGLCLSAGVLAADPSKVLLEVSGVKVTEQDVRAELARFSEPVRERSLQNPATITQMVQTLAARRLLAQEAEKSGLANKPEMKAQLVLMKERVLSDARFEQLDAANLPDPKAAQANARAYYQANPDAFKAPATAHVRHILIEGDTPEAKAKAEKLAAQLKAGGDFEKLAKANSDDKGSAAKGGDLGDAKAGRFVEPFERALDALKTKGEISAPTKTDFGWHIIQLVERKPARVLPFEEVEQRLMGETATKVLAEKRQEKATSLIKGAKINEEAIKALGNTASK